MLADEANMQKQKKREEQLKRWRERELSDQTTTIDSYSMLHKETRVKFPKGCIFLAACSSGDTDEVRQHLKLGVNINTTNIDGLTALHQACIDANQEMVKFLVENSADINAQDNEGWTPLHAAVSVGNLEVAKYLIQKGARLDVCNNDSDLPVDLCDSTNVQMKEYLDEEMKRQAIDAEFEKQKEELIMYEDAKEMNFKDKIHQKTGATPLHVSASKGYLRVIKLLIQCGANVNAVDKDGWTPLHAAAHWEQEEACKILAENGANFEAKTYSGQTPFDVCDKEMAAKLKILQSNSKPVQKIVESTSNYNKSPSSSAIMMNEPLSSRLRRPSDEFGSKSSITRLTNEAKSSISEREKKQDKILLSPISAPSNKPPHFDLYNNNNYSESDNGYIDPDKAKQMNEQSEDSNTNSYKDDDRFTFDKENLNRQQQDQTDQPAAKQQVLSKSNSLNKTKTGLQETLKSLSEKVKLKMDEDKVNDIQFSTKTQEKRKHFSLRELPNKTSFNKNNTDNSNDKLSDAQNNACVPGTTNNISVSPTNNSSSLINSTSTTTTTIPATPSIPSTTSSKNLNNNSTRPYLERRWGTSSGQSEPSTYKRRIGMGAPPTPSTNQQQQQQSPVSSPTTNENQTLADLTSPSNRRYSSAPIASKDEQAELIRKQKAKLERHFRRSTQAVSYEDIKSAEATIKGSSTSTQPNSPVISTNPNTPNSAQTTTTTINEESLNQTPITPAATSSTSTFNFNNSQITTGNILTTVPVNTPPISQQGVSNLSSIFGESIKSNASSSNLFSLQQQQQQQTSNQIEKQQNGAEPTEKDAIIANDIETDKLLNVIEKSKGFLDSYSTTAARRLRNRGIFQFNGSTNPGAVDSSRFSSGQEDAHAANGNNVKKMNKLIWNEEKCEVEYKEKEDDSCSNSTSSSSNSNSSTGLVNSSSSSNLNRQSLQQQHQSSSSPNSLKRQNSVTFNDALSIDVNQPGNSFYQSQQQPQRQMYRFNQNENGLAGSTGVNSNKTAGTPIGSASSSSSSSSSAYINNSTTNNLNNMRTGIKRSVSQVPTTDRRPLTNQVSPTNITSLNNNYTNNENEPVIKDFQAAYELMKKENEILNQTILKLQKELEEQNKKVQNLDSGTLDKREKRAFDRRISELEEEVKKVDNLKQDNNRLKEENAALIRVISKLSK